MWESGPLQVATDVADGGSMYGNWHEGPVHLAIYGPLFHWVLSQFARVCAEPQALAMTVRWFGMECLAIALLAAMIWVRRAGGAVVPAVLAGLGAMFVTPTGLRFIASARPDAMAVALSLLAVPLTLGRRTAFVVIGVLLLVAAEQTKMTAVSAAIAVFFTLAMLRRWRRLLLVVGAYIALNTAIVGALSVGTQAWAWRHLSLPSLAPMRLHYAWYMLARRPHVPEVQLLFVLPVVALLCLAVWPRTQQGRDEVDACRLAGLAYFPVALLAALATGMHQGSDRNYLIEPALAAGVLVGLWAQQVMTTTSSAQHRSARGIAAIGLVCCVILLLPDRTDRFSEGRRVIRQMQNPYTADAFTWARQLPQPLLSLDPWLAYAAGVDNDLNDPIPYICALHDPDFADVVARHVQTGGYAAIVVPGDIEYRGAIYDDIPCIWPALREAAASHYVLRGRQGGWSVYVPVRQFASSD